ncbi:carbon-nitrogen hydrolase family protein [Vibrio sp. Of7-15]|uniref:carbon-nitrogen hydrolase family protein n=1 Tax=Vibrio sp. Of7-15 TaxID=2724879 RepID=UPI001EF19012|nr:carbon-nitrogen hydrolase family protein [Vibrio sp. Of7-15]MCG7499582.1 carbon-nitrogen hydrolase family protein [Vibrio sp. Of7-15]
MDITLVQLDICYKNRQENLNKLGTLLERCDGVGDLVLLPELFTTGYLFEQPDEIHQLAEPMTNSSDTVSYLTRLAQKFQTTFVAGLAEKVESRYYNTVVVVDAKGLVNQYRKMALTNIDKQYFSRGSELVTFTVDGVRFGIAICFDLWFPEVIGEYSRRNIDVLLHPANFGGEQSLQIAQTRAIENNFHVITCNRVGEEITTEVAGRYCGKSQVVSPLGELIFCASEHEEVKTVTINIDSTIKKKVLGVDLDTERKSIINAIKELR